MLPAKLPAVAGSSPSRGVNAPWEVRVGTLRTLIGSLVFFQTKASPHVEFTLWSQRLGTLSSCAAPLVLQKFDCTQGSRREAPNGRDPAVVRRDPSLCAALRSVKL